MTSGPETMLEPRLLEAALAALDRRFGLETAWLFGSQLTGRTTDDSDVDLAAVFRRPPVATELLEAQAELAELFGRDVDLVDLDRASPILVMQVLRRGRLVLDRNPARRIRLIAAAPARYEDVLALRREAEQALLERVRRG